MFLVALAVGLGLALITFPVFDPDLWQHLRVGKLIWETRSIPDTQLWVWPTWSTPYMLPSWLFRVLLYPFWALGGESGLLAWRWIMMLSAMGLTYGAARALGGRGPWMLPALLWCVMLYRFRSQARPETLAMVLMAVQIWLLEKRRAGGTVFGRDPAWAVVPIALVWANAHISFTLGWLITGIHLVASVWPGRSSVSAAPRTLGLVLLASLAASFLTPFGWRTVAEPFQFFFIWRHEPIYRVIGELQGIRWAGFSSALLPFWLVAVGGLFLWRWRTRGFDPVQALMLLAFASQALGSQRFVATMGVALTPYFARDLAEAMGTLRVPARARALFDGAGVALVLAGLSLSASRATDMRPGLGLRWSEYPVRACDWIEAHEVRGKGFNSFDQAGYMLWRFWPDRGRLPFMDIHQSGTKEDRALTAFALTDPPSWRRLDAARRFDYVLLPSRQMFGQRLLDVLDADSTTWRLVFVDDAAALYLRRDGPFAALAERERYRVLPAGDAAVARLAARPVSDTAFVAGLRRELERSVAESPWTSVSHNMLAQLAQATGRPGEAERELRAARDAAWKRPADPKRAK